MATLDLRTFPLAALLACAPALVRAQAAPAAFDIASIDAWLRARVASGAPIGLSASIVADGKVVLDATYGRRSLEGDLAVDAKTLFGIGSVTKQFTCACVLLLDAEKKLSVHDKVAKYFPDLTQADHITLLDLMQHVSGYPDYYPLDYVDERMRAPIEPDALLERYAGGELDFAPGTEWSYSNTGYVLLGRVVEKVTGMPFGGFLESRILTPLGMSDTAFEPARDDARLAHGYTSFALSPPLRNEGEAQGWIGAAGGIWSTAADMAKWNQALLDGKVLAPASWQLMTTARRLADGRLTDYGCGIGVRVQNGREVFAHGGAIDGFAAWTAIVPSKRAAIVLLCNQDSGLGGLGGDLLALLLRDGPAHAPVVAGPPAAQVVRTVFAGLQKGEVAREALTADFAAFLDAEKLAGAAKRLAPLGAPSHVEVVSTRERGRMEVTVTRLRFAERALRVLMYREASGAIAEFFVSAD